MRKNAQVKFMLHLPYELRNKIKRQAIKNGVSMSQYIAIVIEQYIEIEKGVENGKKFKRSGIK